MRTISLRQFRDSIADLTEPHRVLRRDKAGNFQALGEWRPNADIGSTDSAIMGAEDFRVASASDPSRGPRAQQASRDAILRKVNRGG